MSVDIPPLRLGKLLSRCNPIEPVWRSGIYLGDNGFIWVFRSNKKLVRLCLDGPPRRRAFDIDIDCWPERKGIWLGDFEFRPQPSWAANKKEPGKAIIDSGEVYVLGTSNGCIVPARLDRNRYVPRGEAKVFEWALHLKHAPLRVFDSQSGRLLRC